MKLPVRTLLAAILFALCTMHSKAQWVPIEANFAAYIKTYVNSAAINGNQLDTTNPTITSLVNLKISQSIFDTLPAKRINDITGIQYFDNLQYLEVSGGNIVGLPLLPPKLRSLGYNSGYITAIAAPLPASLKLLKLYTSGSYTSFPTLPATLDTLIANCPGVTALPELPASLRYMELRQCQMLDTLPALPGGLHTLILNYARSLPALPALSDSLRWLEVSDDELLTTVPPIPANVYRIDFTGCTNLRYLPALPAGLQWLQLDNTQYGPMDSVPEALTFFSCNRCANMNALPPVPHQITWLSLHHCQLTSIDTLYPVMDYLDISVNPITTIKFLPDTIWQNLVMDSLVLLTSLQQKRLATRNVSADYTPCNDLTGFLANLRHYKNGYNTLYQLSISAQNSNITYCPTFYANIGLLNLSYNPITRVNNQGSSDTSCTGTCPSSLGEGTLILQHCGLTDLSSSWFWDNRVSSLDISNNNITTIDWLPNYYIMGTFDASDNQISDVQIPLNATYIYLQNNQVKCLPYLKRETNRLYVNGNPINCIPNIPDTSFRCDKNLGICMDGNSFGCPVFSQIRGTVYDDANGNGLRNTGDRGLDEVIVVMQPDAYMTQSDSGGRYLFACEVGVTETVNAILNYPYRTITTPSRTAYFTAMGQIDSLNDIGIYGTPDINDMVVHLTNYTPPKPGFDNWYDINAQNIGTTTQSGNIVFNFDPQMNLNSVTPPGTVSGNSVSWPVSNLLPLAHFRATVKLVVPATVPLGTILGAGVHANCNLPEMTIANNHDTIARETIGSYDPNDKSVTPANGLTQQQIAAGEHLDYTIRFQNTGTAPAENVVLRDTLSPSLNLYSFRPVGASASYTWTIKNRVLTVSFKGINLPDKTHNEPESHGFFRYTCIPNTSTPVGEKIPNTAGIYFDYNSAIVTNTTVSPIGTYILRQPQTQVLCTGEPLLLTIKTKPEIIAKLWYKDGVSTGVTSDSFYVPNPTAAYRGYYQCVITARTGKEYLSDKVGVDFITSQTPSFNFNTAGISCSGPGTVSVRYSDNYGVTTYKWYRNGVLQPSTYYSLSAENWADGDTIRCEVSDSFVCSGRVTYSKDTVIHFPAVNKPSISISADTIHVCKGGTASFSARINNPDNLPVSNSMYYYKYPSGNSYFPTNKDNTITFNNITVTTTIVAGAYWTNECTKIIPDTAYIIVDTPGIALPTAHVAFSPTIDCPTQRDTFNAYLLGTGSSLHYQWYTNGVAGGTDNATYINPLFSYGDSVQCHISYKLCTGSSSIDTVVSSATYHTVANAPVPAVTIAQTGSSYQSNSCSSTFTALVTNSGPKPLYQWKRNNTNINNGKSATLTLSSFNIGDSLVCVIKPQLACTDTQYTSNVIYPYPQNKPSLELTISDTVICRSQRQYAYTKVNGDSYFGTDNAYTWYKNDSAIGTGRNFYLPADSNSYTLYYIFKGYNCVAGDTSPVTTITVLRNRVMPTATIVANPVAGCTDDVSASMQVKSYGVSYQTYWYLDDTAMGYYLPGNSLHHGTKVAGYVTFSSNTCLASNKLSDSLVIRYADQTPQLNITSPGLCTATEYTKLTAQYTYGGAAPTFLWKKNGILVGDNSNTYYDVSLTRRDVIYCRMTSTNPCAVPQTVTKTIVLPDVTYKLGIGYTGDSLISSLTAATYRWTVNGLSIFNGNTHSIPYLGEGEYKLEVTDYAGCVYTTSYLVTGITELPTGGVSVKLYPNPNNGQFSIEFSDDVTRDIIISDATGRTVAMMPVTHQKQMNLSGLTSGLYFITVKDKHQSQSLKFVLMNN